jgi:hypothetical protein
MGGKIWVAKVASSNKELFKCQQFLQTKMWWREGHVNKILVVELEAIFTAAFICFE